MVKMFGLLTQTLIKRMLVKLIMNRGIVRYLKIDVLVGLISYALFVVCKTMIKKSKRLIITYVFIGRGIIDLAAALLVFESKHGAEIKTKLENDVYRYWTIRIASKNNISGSKSESVATQIERTVGECYFERGLCKSVSVAKSMLKKTTLWKEFEVVGC